MRGQIGIAPEDITARPMHEKQRRLGALSLNGDNTRLAAISGGVAQHGFELLNGGSLEYGYQRELAPRKPFHFSKQAHGQQRMATELKKIIADSDTLDAEQFLPSLT